MKSLEFLITNLTLIFSFQVLLFAQQPTAPTKIAAVSFEKFSDVSTGIKDVIVVYEKLEQEFKPQNQELMLIAENSKKILNEINQILKKKVICQPDAKLITEKSDAYELMLGRLAIKQQMAKTLYDKRESFLREEIDKKIAESLKLFAKEKGYAVVLDGSQKNIVIEGEIIDITNEFIHFYNIRTEKKIN